MTESLPEHNPMENPTQTIQETESPRDIEREARTWFDNDELRTRCFLDKYALKDIAGIIRESTPEEMWKRVASEIASAEETPEKREEWKQKFYWLLKNFNMIPGGRILFGAGQPRKATLLNCYVVPIKQDSIEGIFECCKQMARTYSYGGGVGTDISVLRPRGTSVNNSAIFSTGAVSFMDLLSKTTGTIGQSGRRGALMITISSDHPDVEEFISVKNDELRQSVRFANISIRMSDRFMRAVEENNPIDLIYESEKTQKIIKTVDAKKVWEKLIKNAHSSAEPGLIFWDNVKRESTTEYNGMNVVSTNPCSEIPLDPYGCCCLGNVNLSRIVANEFTEQATIDWESLERTLRYTVRFLDDVLTYNEEKHPLKEQRDTSRRSRRIGVGFTGFADFLIKLGKKYDSEEAITFTDALFDRVKNIVYDESVNTATEKGTFLAFDLEKHLRSPFLQRLDPDVLQRIKEHGLRNAALLTVPPVGSGSVLAGTSSGIEPLFALSYTRRSESLSKETFRVHSPIVKAYLRHHNLDSEEHLSDVFVTSHQIDPNMRIKMQGAIQRHIDHAISSTINLPEDTTPDAISNIYRSAWKLGLKGVTVYREGSREGILITDKKSTSKKTQQQQTSAKRRKRPAITTGETQRLQTGYGSIYVTINRDAQGPFEVFGTIGKSGGFTTSFTEACSRLMSLALQHRIPAKDIIAQLKDIRSPKIAWDNGTPVHSIPDAMATALERALNGQSQSIQATVSSFSEPTADVEANTKAVIKEGINPECPDCSAFVQFIEGCVKCPLCGWSECGG